MIFVWDYVISSNIAIFYIGTGVIRIIKTGSDKPPPNILHIILWF